MATVSGGTVFGLNFDTLDAAALVDYDQSDLQSTSARFFDDPSNYTLFQGVGFSYVSGVPVGGTVTSVQYVVNGSTVLRITGLSVAVTDVMAFVDSGDTTGLLNLALAGNDTLNGTPLADVLYGFAGNDVLKGGLGLDTLDGGVGLDTADYSDKTTAVAVTLNGAIAAVVKVGGVNEDTIKNIENVTGGSAADALNGDGLANTLIGNAGNDILKGFAGNDILKGGLGLDTLDGGVGLDTADYSDKTTAVAVTLNGAIAAVVKVGGVNEDTIKNIENVTGGSAADALNGDGLANTLIGNAGNDILKGFAGNDTFVGGAGNDTMDGGTGLDTVDYSLDVRAGATHGITANLLAAAQGGLAADTVIGSFGDTDHVPNIRNLIGTQFADTILGGGRANVLQGGAGNDVIDGEGGSDTLTGGTGNDTFAFHLQSGGGGGGGIDTITDFSVADDTFRLENSVFTAFTTPGVMSDADFHAHILYNSATGALSYDANGVLAGGISQFATIGHGLILTHDDFLIA